MFCSKCGCQMSSDPNFCNVCELKPNETSTEMARKLTITRPTVFVGIALAFNVFINDIECDNINNNQIKFYIIPEGQHKIQIKLKPLLGSLIESNVIIIGETDRDINLKVEMKMGLIKNKLLLERLF